MLYVGLLVVLYGTCWQPYHSLCYFVFFQLQANQHIISYDSTSTNISRAALTVCYCYPNAMHELTLVYCRVTERIQS